MKLTDTYKYMKRAAFALVGLLALGSVSCDNIDESDRLIDYPLPEAKKNVLIMEIQDGKL